MKTMKSFLSTPFLLAALVLLYGGCSFEIPFGPFEDLDNEAVTAEMSILDAVPEQGDSLELKAVIPDEVKAVVTGWSWEIKDIFGDVVKTCEEEVFSLPDGLFAEDYKVILTITDAEGNTKSFGKNFTIKPLEVLKVTGLLPDHDTGVSSSDMVTRTNQGLKLLCETETPNAAVTLVMEDTVSSYKKSYAATTDENGAFYLFLEDSAPFADSEYQIRFYRDAKPKNKSRWTPLVIDTTQPVLEWVNELPVGGFEYGADPAELRLVRAAGEDKLDETSIVSGAGTDSFNARLAGVQAIAAYACDLAGNRSDTLSRDVTVNGAVHELVDGGGFVGADNMIAENWFLGAKGYQDPTNAMQPHVWGPWVESEFGGVLKNIVENYATDLIWRTQHDGKSCIQFQGGLKTAGGLFGEHWLTRVQGHAYQTIPVYAGVTYRVSVSAKFGGGGRASWNSLMVRSSDASLTFVEPYDAPLSQEPDFGVDGLSTRIARIKAEDPGAMDWGTLSVDFTPESDGFVYVGVIKSDIDDGSNPNNGASYFSDLSVVGIDWPGKTP